ncbi:MAG TPA: DUF438 domain-containing protein [Clostridiales bacterium]|nr:DUF438 domain-containing protein [Clostridiales bacterium]
MNKEKKQILKEIIKSLHNGASLEEAKAKFQKEFANVSSIEIAQAEQELINEGLPIEEVQRLCDVHSSIFKDSIQNEFEKPDIYVEHSILNINKENKDIEKIIQEIEKANSVDKIIVEKLLSTVDLHYQKKEIVLFPYLEKYDITSPPKVMWGVDDEIRDALKDVLAKIDGNADQNTIKELLDSCVVRIKDMIFKEQSILLPMMMDTLKKQDWEEIFPQLQNFNQAPDQKTDYSDTQKAKAEGASLGFESDYINLPSGKFRLNELIASLNALPFDITFVDSEDKVAYFSEGKERIFPRERAVIGRSVFNCHPPKSQHIVKDIMQSFKDGKKDHEDFWIKMGDKYVLIRYFAVRNQDGAYLGTLEVTQNIAPLQTITGEKRLLS